MTYFRGYSFFCFAVLAVIFFRVPAAFAEGPPRRAALETDRPDLDFSLYRLGPGAGPTLMIVGGIQGDEPGGFSAAALLITRYAVKSGQVWVVPNLNFPSIVKRNRGSFGDMNRKFAHVDPGDPDYDAVVRIQKIIRAPEVNAVLNLHDGSGFYRPQWESPLHNPKRWGQCVIIDQENMDSPAFGRLAEMAQAAVKDANKGLLKEEHRYHVRNTETAKGDADMAKTLSYFAIRNGKPAFGLEASKSFTTEYRTYYHLRVVESFMRQMGIDFERNFSLTPQAVKDAINSGLGVALYDSRLVLALDNVRPALNYVPMKKGAPLDVKATTPLLALLQDKKTASWRVAYGNRTLTRLSPQYMEYDESLTGVEAVLDGKTRSIPVGRLVTVENSFLIKSMRGYRVNAIGAVREKKDGSECGVVLRKSDFIPRYSVDRNETTYRVEIYKGKAFAGMLLVKFGKALPASRETMTAVKGPESDFGF